jgi:hypothetical protein
LQKPEHLTEYNAEIGRILDTIESNNVALLHYATGRAITAWALMEERLVVIASLLLRTSPKKTGLIFYSIINFQVWITIITELFDLDSDFKSFQRRWNKIFERLRAEKDNRDRLAHHYVMSSDISDNPLGLAVKAASRIDMRTKSLKAAPLTIEQVSKFQKRIEQLSDDLRDLMNDIQAHAWPDPPVPSPERPSEQGSDQ